MTDEIYILKNDGQLEAMREQSFDLEDVLQRLVADHPELLSGQQIDPDNPRRWILVNREQGISDIIGGGNRWALDHLLIDQDAIPTLVEVKRSENSEIRRTIVGQMLDYAAHARHSWSAGDIRRVFEERTTSAGQDSNNVLAELLQTDEDPDADEFWQLVETNLRAARLRLLFVADGIPDELTRVVEFLNEQMPGIEVLAVEIKPTQEATSTTTVTTLKWVNYEQSAVVAGRNIGGMVYLGPDLRQGALSATWKPTIVPTLPVAASGPDITGDGMPYWPSYSEIGPNSRAAYLDRLATGRSDRRYGVGHVFLYFYGLERRFFIDSSGPHERRIIIDEVDRLLQIYGDHRSVRRYFESFLDAAKVSLASDEELKPRFWTAGYELPLGLRVALGRRAGDGLPLNAD